MHFQAAHITSEIENKRKAGEPINKREPVPYFVANDVIKVVMMAYLTFRRFFISSKITDYLCRGVKMPFLEL